MITQINAVCPEQAAVMGMVAFPVLIVLEHVNDNQPLLQKIPAEVVSK